MAKRKNWSKDPWQPTLAFQELLDGKSGNDFNGLGETEPRQPDRVFWVQPSSDGPFGPVQDCIVERHNTVPELLAVYANADRGPSERSEPGKLAEPRSTTAWTDGLQEFALANESDQVGVATIEPQWMYEGFTTEMPFVVVLVVAMDHSRSRELPPSNEHPDWAHEVAVQYNRGSRAARKLTKWIKSQGYQAKSHTGPWVGSMNLIPAAIAAGVGELGKHGSLINRELGSSFRLAAVETDLPLEVNQPDRFGADEFCLGCQVCTNACPPQAISQEKQQVRGDEKWYVDFDKCIGYFNETYGCAICISVCPWSTPGRAPNLAERWTKRIIVKGQ
ncbi:MAG: 4Fe-4S dicluster domain-containing protein [Pseudomonadales bacterium]|nr:4Fe-4S dicluster domain-containing protein [Pseudomonadales bacterium]